jgi:hypothetical protein
MKAQATEGTRSNIVFTDSIALSQREKLFGRIIQDGLRERQGEMLYRSPDKFDEYQEYILSQDEEDVLSELLHTAHESLADIGLPDPGTLLPAREQILFKERLELAEEAIIACNEFGQFITIAIPFGVRLHFLNSQKAFFRAIAKFVYTRVITKPGPHYYSAFLVERGYTLKAVGLDEIEGEEYRGIYSDALADLFALSTIHSFVASGAPSIEMSTIFDSGAAFLVALLITYAQKTGTTSLAAFKRLFKAHALRDFSLQTELANVFGSETMAAINSLEPVSPYGPSSKTYQQVAARGKFLHKYLSLREKIHSGGLLPFPGIPGGLRRHPDWYVAHM